MKNVKMKNKIKDVWSRERFDSENRQAGDSFLNAISRNVFKLLQSTSIYIIHKLYKLKFKKTTTEVMMIL